MIPVSAPDELRNIRDHLRSGCFGQREVWERQLERAATMLEERAGGEMSSIILAGIRQFGLAPDGSDLRDLAAALERKDAEIERLGAGIQTQGAEIDRVCTMALKSAQENTRLRALLNDWLSGGCPAEETRTALEEGK